MTKRAFLSLSLMIVMGLSLATTVLAAPAKPIDGEYVEFIIGDRTEETRKWGHVSLRVVTRGQDQIFDFGRKCLNENQFG